jgi:hypothetical protein
MKYNSKAQITPFIIVGIIIIIASAFFLYYRNFIIPEAEYVPEDIKPVKSYIGSCLDDTAEDAITLLGMQSGYIEIPDEIRLNRAYVQFLTRSPFLIPYWNQNGVSYIPTLETMQIQISNYIEQNIRDCVDLTLFERDLFIEDNKEIEVETIIGNKDVDISMNYELIITDKNGDQTKISTYQQTMPVKLKQAYELGQKIMQAENSQSYFENMTIDWISMNPDIPLNGLEFHCTQSKWRLTDIEEELQDMIYYNLPRVKVKNTAHEGFLADEDVYEELSKYTLEDIYLGNTPDIEKPEDAYDYFHYLMDVRTKKTDLKAAFYYHPSWDIDLVGRPNEDGQLVSKKQEGNSEFLDFICLNVYHFNYDISYPIEVLIRDDESFNNKGFVFRYAFPIYINHNYPDRGGFSNTEFIQFGGEFIGECDGLKGDIYDIRALGVDDFGIANMELKNVNLTYDCFKFSCGLGKTEADEGSYRLRTQLPDSCAHGYMVAEKEGYLSSRQQVLDDEDIDIDMIKLKTLRFKVVLNDYNSITDSIGDDEEINEFFLASINLQSIDEPSYQVYKKYPFDEDSDDKTIDLLEQNSKYSLDITLFDEADGVLIGGYTGNFSVRYNDLVDAKEIIFHTAGYLPKPIATNEEQKVFEFLDENNIYKDRLKPELR